MSFSCFALSMQVIVRFANKLPSRELADVGVSWLVFRLWMGGVGIASSWELSSRTHCRSGYDSFRKDPS